MNSVNDNSANKNDNRVLGRQLSLEELEQVAGAGDCGFCGNAVDTSPNCDNLEQK